MSKKNYLRASVGAALLVAASLCSPATANASVGCSGASCQGKDPNAMGCGSDAVTRYEFSTDTIRIELRYSRNCFAGWVRASAIKQGYINYPEVVSYATSTTSVEKSWYWAPWSSTYTTAWSDMMSVDGQWVAACNGQGGTGTIHCTARI